jgi:hypothetical protein
VGFGRKVWEADLRTAGLARVIGVRFTDLQALQQLEIRQWCGGVGIFCQGETGESDEKRVAREQR